MYEDHEALKVIEVTSNARRRSVNVADLHVKLSRFREIVTRVSLASAKEWSLAFSLGFALIFLLTSLTGVLGQVGGVELIHYLK